MDFIRQCKELANLYHTIDNSWLAIRIFISKLLQTWPEQCGCSILSIRYSVLVTSSTISVIILNHSEFACLSVFSSYTDWPIFVKLGGQRSNSQKWPNLHQILQSNPRSADTGSDLTKVKVIEVKFTKMTIPSPKFAPPSTNATGTELLVRRRQSFVIHPNGGWWQSNSSYM
jgi:hypothetical protein